MSHQGAVKDAAWVSGAQCFRAISGFFSSVLIARALGPAGFGLYAIVQSVSDALAMLADAGVGQTAVRFAARSATEGNADGQRAGIQWVLRIKMFAIITLATITWLLAPYLARDVWGNELLLGLLRLYSVTSVFVVMVSVPMIHYQSLKRFAVIGLTVILQASLSLFVILILLWTGCLSLTTVAVSALLVSLVTALCLFLTLPRDFIKAKAFAREFSWRGFRDFWHHPAGRENISSAQAIDGTSAGWFAFYLALSAAAVSLTSRLDIWMIGAWLPASDAGVYSVGLRMALPLAILQSSLTTSFWPRAASACRRADSVRLLHSMLRIGACAAFIGLIYAVSIPRLAPRIFGESYAASSIIGQLMSVRLCFCMIVCPLGIIGYNFGLVKFYWIVSLIQLAVTLVLNMYFLPVWGVAGAIAAWFGSDIIGMSLVVVAVVRKVLLVESRQEAVVCHTMGEQSFYETEYIRDISPPAIPTDDNFMYWQVIRELRPYLMPGTSVLDVGCNTGRMSFYMASRGCHVIGIDIAENAIETARKAAAHHRLSAVVFRQSAFDSSWVGPAVDLIHCCNVLEHVPDDKAFLLNAVSALRPGGHMLLIVPSTRSFYYLACLFFAGYCERDEKVGHKRRYSMERICSLARECGLVVEKTAVIDGFARELLTQWEFLKPVQRIFWRPIPSAVFNWLDRIAARIHFAGGICIHAYKPVQP